MNNWYVRIIFAIIIAYTQEISLLNTYLLWEIWNELIEIKMKLK